MARQTIDIITSDLSGETVPESEAAIVVITYSDRSTRTVDAAKSELAQFENKGKLAKPRGRAPGTKNKPKDSKAV
jgi:hypothetical protein